MRAVILAGGAGSRLRPLTDLVPKPLVPINNVPIIEWQLRHLRAHGIDEVVVSSGYLAGMIEDHLGRRDLGVRITYSAEDSPLGTGGAIRRAAEHAGGGSFIVINGDVITDIDLQRLAARPDSVAAVRLRTKYGVMDVDGDAVSGFREKGEVAGVWMNAGVYHLGPGLVAALPERGDIERTVFPEYARRGGLFAVRFPGAMWHSIDSFRDIEEAAADLAARPRAPAR